MTTWNRTIKPRICLSIALSVSGLIATVVTAF